MPDVTPGPPQEGHPVTTSTPTDEERDLAEEVAAIGSDVAEDEPLGRQVSRGFRWSLIGQLVNRIGVFTTGIVLARLLTPHEFGIYAVALAAFNLVMMINEVGMVAAIVRAPDDELTEAVNTGATLAMGMSLLLAGLTFLAASWFAGALGASEATGILRLFTVSVVIDGAMTAPLALLGRTFQQGRMVAADLTGLLVYMLGASVLAFAGAGPWSIAIARVASSAVSAVMLLVFSPQMPRPHIDRVQARKLLRFGVPLTTAALVAEAVMNADYLVVGKVLGATSLGLYLLAFNLSTWPVSAVLAAIGRVAFPAFARLSEDPPRMRRAYTNAVGIIATGIIPIVVLLAALSPNVIQFIYGGRWLPSATPLRFLLVLAIGRVIIQTTQEFLAACGVAGTILKIQTAWLVVLVPVLTVGAERYGIAGVGIGHMVVVTVWVVPLVALAARRQGVDLARVAVQFVRPVIGAAGALATVAVVTHVLGGSFVQLLVGGLAGVAVYAAIVLPHNSLIEWGWNQARGRGQQLAPVGA